MFLNTTTLSSLDREAIRHATAMVTRYKSAVARHPRVGPLTTRQTHERQNLSSWDRRLNKLEAARL